MACFVADGMGGAAAGGLAAELAIEAAKAHLRTAGTHFPLRSLRKAYACANEAVLAQSRTATEMTGMGTTLSIAWFCGGLLYCGHVGDSRIYRIRDGRIQQLSNDHSYVADLLRAGLIDDGQARLHPDQNLITRAVGTNALLQADIWCERQPPQPGDRYLLCSDGLHGLLSSDTILNELNGRVTDEVCRRLVRLARQAGGHDNISAALVSVSAVDERPPNQVRQTRTQIPV